MLLADIKLFPEAASDFAERVDNLFFFILAVVVFFTLMIATMVISFLIRYRRRSESEVPRRIEGSLALEVTWTIIPLLIAMVMFVWGARLYMDWAEPPEDALEVYAIGRQWMWQLQHANGQREINQ